VIPLIEKFLLSNQAAFPDPSILKGLRIHYYVRHPHLLRGQWHFKNTLTASPGRGIQFIEQWQVSRIAVVVLTAVASTVVTGVVYAHCKHDVSGAFAIAGSSHLILS
jgi:hypothetical protein